MSVPLAQSSYRIDADTARGIAEEFLIRQVGDLLTAGEPSVIHGGCWVVPALLGNVAQGLLAEVGSILIDATTGQIRFSKEERVRMEARARQLVDASER
jgi:hypothetical protein